MWLRRVITMLPTVIIVSAGIDPTYTIVVSQVILSIVLPAPIISLIYFTRKEDIMGVLVNKNKTTILASIAAALILLLNIFLILQTFGFNLPFLN
jgi:manganese transport protein